MLRDVAVLPRPDHVVGGVGEVVIFTVLRVEDACALLVLHELVVEVVVPEAAEEPATLVVFV